jgi:hypothetical protein
MSGTTEIRPFRVDIADEAIADLRRRDVDADSHQKISRAFLDKQPAGA